MIGTLNLFSESLAPENQIPYAMPEAQSALLEFGERAVIRARRVIDHGVFQQRLTGQHLQHLLGVVFPVGCAVNVAARLRRLVSKATSGA